MSFRRAPYYVDPQGHTLQTREVTIGNAISKAVFNEKRNGIGDFAGMQPEIRTAFGPGSWKPDTCYQEMKGAVESFTDHELPLVAALAHDGTGIKLDERKRFSNPIVRDHLAQLSWFKEANMALALVKDAASKFMAGPPMVEARELVLDDARWSALFRKAPPRFSMALAVCHERAAERAARVPPHGPGRSGTGARRADGVAPMAAQVWSLNPWRDTPMLDALKRHDGRRCNKASRPDSSRAGASALLGRTLVPRLQDRGTHGCRRSGGHGGLLALNVMAGGYATLELERRSLRVALLAPERAAAHALRWQPL